MYHRTGDIHIGASNGPSQGKYLKIEKASTEEGLGDDVTCV